MDINELNERLKAIKDMGWIVSKRKGNTGIGYTLETLLDLKENNLKTADFGEIELKSQRKNASSLVTMFTFNNGAWLIPTKEVVEKYGYVDSQGRKALYSTVNTHPNAQGLYLEIKNDDLNLYHLDATLIAKWRIENIIGTFSKKMPSLVEVYAKTRKNSDGKEEFLFDEAFFLKNPDAGKFIKLIRKNVVVVDIRMHLKNNGSVRNHGTGFRINEKFLKNCFSKKVRLI